MDITNVLATIGVVFAVVALFVRALHIQRTSRHLTAPPIARSRAPRLPPGVGPL